MAPTRLPSHSDDPLWPRAAHWLAKSAAGPAGELPSADLALLGVGAFASSITQTGARATPAAVREALLLYSTLAASRGVDVSELRAIDLGDVDSPDGSDGEARVSAAVAGALKRFALLVALGGDNSITYSLMRGLFGADLPHSGLITIDAHHDVRDGESNGSPVRRLIEAGLPGVYVVQIGIADFSNSAAYAERAHQLGITIVNRAELRDGDFAEIVSRALKVAGADGRKVYVDIDADVCDRAAVPGCPSAAPGGLSADELRQLTFLLARDPRVCAIDITEIDATADTPDRRTVRLAALLVLEAAAGLCARKGLGTRREG